MALTCTLSNNILRTTSCGYSLPTVTDIYVANWNDVSASTVSASTGGCEEVASITLASGKKWYHIEPAKDSTSFTDELVIGDSGNRYRTQSITFSISAAYTACMHKNLDDLSLGRYLVVVKNAEGTFLALGRLAGLEASAASVAGGADQNGLNITLSADVTESASPLATSAVTALLANVAADA